MLNNTCYPTCYAFEFSHTSFHSNVKLICVASAVTNDKVIAATQRKHTRQRVRTCIFKLPHGALAGFCIVQPELTVGRDGVKMSVCVGCERNAGYVDRPPKIKHIIALITGFERRLLSVKVPDLEQLFLATRRGNA